MLSYKNFKFYVVFYVVILFGDYNIKVLKRDRLYYKCTSILKSYNLTYKIDFPSRVCLGSESAIDNVICNIKDIECKVRRLIAHISDHDAQLSEMFGLKTNKNKIFKK